MRKVVLCLGVSIDGYIARKNGDVDFLFMPKDFSMGPFFAGIDVALMGRKTYEESQKIGPPPGGSATESYVFSRTLPSGHRNGTTFTQDPPEQLVKAIRDKPGMDIWLMGGGELIRDFLKADLVGELFLGIVPTLLGEGIPLFPAGFPQRDFTLIENKSYSKGLVSLTYARARKAAKKKR